jgi:PAS domain S-box-containing protein
MGEDRAARAAIAAQLALSASEERLHLALHTAGMGIIDIRRPSREGFYSDEYLRLYGYAAEHRAWFMAGWEPLVHPDDAPALIEFRKHVWRGDTEVLDTQARRMHCDGRWIWVRAVGRAFEPDAAGIPTRWLSTVVNVDHTRRNELALQESEARLRLAQSIARLGDWRVDAKTMRHRWSDEAWRVLGLMPGECEASMRTFLAHVHPGDVPRLADIARRLEEGFFDADEDARIVLPDGNVRHVQLQVRVARAANGQIQGLIGTIQDVTECRLAERAARAAAADLALAQQIARVGNWRWSRADNTLSWTPIMFNILDVDADGAPVPFDQQASLFTATSWERLQALRRHALDHGDPYEIELELVRRDGVPAWVMARGEVAHDAQGHIIGLFGTVQDITAHKLAEAGLREARDQLRSLSSHHEDVLTEQRRRIALDVHDEVGQMLTAMKLQIDLLQSELAGRSAALASAERLRQLVDDTIEVTRNVALNLHPPALDLGLVPALEWLAEDFSLRTDIPCTVRAAAGDAAVDAKAAIELFRIAQESLTNVARHAQARSVQLRLAPTRGALCMSIRDDGCGFDAAGAGVGRHFGLLGMRERALRLGAVLEIQSVVRAGTTVRVTLPASPTQSTEPAP